MDLKGNNPITDNGTYIVDDMLPGSQYLCTIAGSFGSPSGTLVVKYKDAVTGDARTMTDGSFTAAAEFTLILPGDEVQFILTGATAPSISINLTRILS
jgi:hypothetical protein